MQMNKASENISVSLPSWLIEIIYYFCEQHDYNRSTLVQTALKHYILTKRNCPAVWQQIYDDMREKSS